MRVLVTGNRGFIGRTLESALSADGWEVTGFDLADGRDVLDYPALAEAARGCRALVHLAALEGRKDQSVLETNLLGAWNVLSATRDGGLEKIILMSSVDALGVFQGEGAPLYLPLDDAYPCHPQAVYSISKKLAEEMARHFSRASGIPVICLRPPGVWDSATYRQITRARQERPEYEWDPYWEYGAFLDIRDLAEAVRLALRREIRGFHCLLLAAEDITTSGPTSLELVNRIHPGVPWRGGEEYQREPYRSLVDSRPARALLGWSPRYSWRAFQENSADGH